MKRILIVDDEYLVRLGLKTIIDWAAFGYTVAGEAANGKEALDFFEKNPVDVILTDIKMPVMDGLELIRKVKAIDKKVQIIILSHYDEFSYAQEAVNLGAFRYILKSELTKTNLENVLKSLHLSSSDVEPYGQAVLSDNDKWELFIKEQVLPVFHHSMEHEKEIKPPPAPETDNSVIFSVSCRSTPLSSEAREKFPKAIRILFDEAFVNLAGCGHYYNGNFQFAAIMHLDKGRAKEAHLNGAHLNEAHLNDAYLLHEKIHNSCVQIAKNIHQYYDVNVFIGVSSAGTSSSETSFQGKTNDFWQLLQEAHKARTGCFFHPGLLVNIFNQENDIDTAGVSKSTDRVSYTKLVAFFETNKKDAMLEYIQSIFSELRIKKNFAAVHDVYIDFLSVGKLIHEKYSLKEEASLSEAKFRHDTFFDLPFIDDVEKYIHELYLSLFSTKQNGEASYSRIVRKCIDFIHSNYKNNIGLAEAEAEAGVSHSYLSFIFKQETGVNFSAALNQHRIENAKNLLATTSLRIYQVAEQVGFSNPYYFSKVFKEITGYSCKEYRDRVVLPST